MNVVLVAAVSENVSLLSAMVKIETCTVISGSSFAYCVECTLFT